MCYFLWTWWNREEHGDDFHKPFDSGAYVFQKAKEYGETMSIDRIVQGRDREVKLIAWLPLNKDLVKLNMDGASKENKSIRCGGVIRDDKCSWVSSFAKFLGDYNSLMAELWGIFEGLKISSLLGFKKVDVNMDSIMVVHVIDRGGAYMRESLAIIRKIQGMMGKFENVC